MDEYIERGVAIREIEQINPVDYGAMWDYEAHNWTGKCLRDCKEAIDSISAADVAPVVRCKGCKNSCKDGTGRTCEGYWYELSEFAVLVEDDDFCSYGERKPSADG